MNEAEYDLTARARVRITDLVPYEREVLVSIVRRAPRPWGAAIGAARETLHSLGLLESVLGDETPLGREVVRLLTEGGA